jgi:hypothetical protein
VLVHDPPLELGTTASGTTPPPSTRRRTRLTSRASGSAKTENQSLKKLQNLRQPQRIHDDLELASGSPPRTTKRRRHSSTREKS